MDLFKIHYSVHLYANQTSIKINIVKKKFNSILQLPIYMYGTYPFLIFFVDWSNTTLGASPMALNQSSMTLPYVLHEFTPNWVAILGMQYAETCTSFFNIAYMDLEFISIVAQDEKYFGILKNLYQ